MGPAKRPMLFPVNTLAPVGGIVTKNKGYVQEHRCKTVQLISNKEICKLNVENRSSEYSELKYEQELKLCFQTANHIS